MLKRLSHNKKLLAFFLSFLLGSLIIIPNMISGGGIYHLYADFDLQEIPFNMIINSSIKEGSFLWTWHSDFGSNFIGTYSFYNLFSPFSLIGYLFPAKIFPYLIGPIFILKYAIAGLCAFLFLKRYVRNPNYAIIGSLLYTFSGFQLTNVLFYQFHDAVAFFPLLLYSFDNLVYDHKKGRFLFVVTLCAITNWFFFIGEVFFVILYYFVKIITREYSFQWRQLFMILLEGVLGTLCAMFILMPTFLFTVDNPRLTTNWTIVSALRMSILDYLEIFSSFIMPAQTMLSRAVLHSSNYSSVDFYLPVVGIVCVIPYLIKNPKKSTSIIIFISVLCMFIPILNSIFFLFNTSYYARWFYMPILFFSLASVLCMEERIPLKNGNIGTAISLLIVLFMIVLYGFLRENVVFDTFYFIVMIVLTIINWIITNILYRKDNFSKWIIAIFLFITIFGNFMIYQYQKGHVVSNYEYHHYLRYDPVLEQTIKGRSNSSASCEANLSHVKKIPNIRSFISNINGFTFTFLNSVGIERTTSTIIPVENKLLNNILGVEYIVACRGDTPSSYGYVYDQDIDDYHIYHNEEVKKMGYSVGNYILDEQYDLLSYSEKIETLQNFVVLSRKQVQSYSKFYPNDVSYSNYEFQYLKNGFSAKIQSSSETLAVFQIPYDKGWNATNNGKRVSVENVNHGFMAIPISSGDNMIRFQYRTPGLFFGFILSGVSFIISILYEFIIRRLKV